MIAAEGVISPYTVLLAIVAGANGSIWWEPLSVRYLGSPTGSMEFLKR
jgi:hypothetical protein